MFNKCIKGRNRYKAKFHHKIKLEHNHKKTVAIKDIDTIYTCYRLKGGWTATPASSGTYPTTAVAPPNGWGQPRDRGNRRARGEPVAEPREAPINTRSGYDASEGVPGGSQDASVWVHLASFLERSLATFLGRLEH